MSNNCKQLGVLAIVETNNPLEIPRIHWIKDELKTLEHLKLVLAPILHSNQLYQGLQDNLLYVVHHQLLHLLHTITSHQYPIRVLYLEEALSHCLDPSNSSSSSQLITIPLPVATAVQWYQAQAITTMLDWDQEIFLAISIEIFLEIFQHHLKAAIFLVNFSRGNTPIELKSTLSSWSIIFLLSVWLVSLSLRSISLTFLAHSRLLCLFYMTL